MKTFIKSLFALILIYSFSPFSNAADNIAYDLVTYVNQSLMNIAELEQKSLEKYASVIGENYTTDESVYKVLNDDVLPLYERFYDLLRVIAPKTKEVNQLQQIYVRGARLIFEGFKLKKLGIEQKNESIIIMGNKKIEQGRDEVEKWRNELLELCKKYGVKQQKK